MSGTITASGAAGVTGDARAVRHGELAFAAIGRLFLLGGRARGLRQVSLPGIADAPAWSPDHRWLAVEVTKPWPATKPWLQGPARLWLVSATGARIRRLTPRSWDVTSFAWSPRAVRLVAVACRSPDGRQIAAGVATFRRHRWLGRLDLLSPAGGPPRVVRPAKTT